MRSNPWQAYRQVATQTASPGQLVLMLYDGAIRALDRASAGFSCEDPLEFNRTINNEVQKAQAIINELNLSLNLEAGGEFASKMQGLYTYLDRKLQDSNRLKQPDGIQEVIQRLTVLRDAWAEMLQNHLPDQNPNPSLPSAHLT